MVCFIRLILKFITYMLGEWKEKRQGFAEIFGGEMSFNYARRNCVQCLVKEDHKDGWRSWWRWLCLLGEDA